MDYLLRKVEFLGNVALDDHAADSGYSLDEEEIEQVKLDLANTSEAFMRLTERINAPVRKQQPGGAGGKGRIMIVTADEVGSEFVLESLLMKIQALTTKYPSNEQVIMKYLKRQGVGMNPGQGGASGQMPMDSVQIQPDGTAKIAIEEKHFVTDK